MEIEKSINHQTLYKLVTRRVNWTSKPKLTTHGLKTRKKISNIKVGGMWRCIMNSIKILERVVDVRV